MFNNTVSAAPALADSPTVWQGGREPRLKKLDGISISKEGCSRILDRLQKVHMAKSARRAITGDEVCVGHTFKDQPFIHPKTESGRSLDEALVEGIGKHPTLPKYKFSSIQINHNTICAPHTGSNL